MWTVDWYLTSIFLFLISLILLVLLIWTVIARWKERARLLALCKAMEKLGAAIEGLRKHDFPTNQHELIMKSWSGLTQNSESYVIDLDDDESRANSIFNSASSSLRCLDTYDLERKQAQETIDELNNLIGREAVLAENGGNELVKTKTLIQCSKLAQTAFDKGDYLQAANIAKRSKNAAVYDTVESLDALLATFISQTFHAVSGK